MNRGRREEPGEETTGRAGKFPPGEVELLLFYHKKTLKNRLQSSRISPKRIQLIGMICIRKVRLKRPMTISSTRMP